MRRKNSSRQKKLSWHDINWIQVRKRVLKKQIKIGVAYNNKDFGLLTQQQDNLVRSWEARALAVRTITTNKGKKTPGVDNIVWDTPRTKYAAIGQQLIDRNSYKCQKVKRVYIPKAKGGLRPLGIPCMIDRRYQSLWKQALEPCREYRGDRHSYGFRIGRSTKDAQTMQHQLFGSKYRPMWRMDADIKGFFDNISHKWQLENIPINKVVLKSWLEAGALDMVTQEEIAIVSGVPQGGPISPTIANMALDGLQDHVKNRVYGHYKSGSSYRKGYYSPKVNVVRYRDDFVITAASQRILTNQVKPRVNSFLRARGLSLNERKTQIMPIKKGLDFLGYNFRIYPYSKRQTGYIGLTKPTKSGVKRLLTNCKKVISTSKDAGEIVFKQNPILRGWANYYSCTTAKQIFSKIGWRLWFILLKWAVKKHPTMGKRRLVQRYFKKVGGRAWVFYGNYNDKEILLFDIRSTPIVRHRMVLDKIPYKEEDQEYFNKRRLKGAKNLIAWDKRRLKFVKKQKFLCPVCEQLLLPEQDIDLHHILAKNKGGTNADSNLVALHRECHHQVTYRKDATLLAQFRRKGVLK